jgi:hypothetical protein
MMNPRKFAAGFFVSEVGRRPPGAVISIDAAGVLKRAAVRTSLPARANAPAAAPLILPERDKVRAPNEPAHQAC